MARTIQKHHRLLSLLESLDSGTLVREARDADLPLIIRHFYHHAGWAQLMEVEMKDWKPLGELGHAGILAWGAGLRFPPFPASHLSRWGGAAAQPYPSVCGLLQ